MPRIGPRSPRRRRRQLSRLSGRDVIDIMLRRSANSSTVEDAGPADLRRASASMSPPLALPLPRPPPPKPPPPRPPERHRSRPPPRGTQTERGDAAHHRATASARSRQHLQLGRRALSDRPTQATATSADSPASQTLIPGTDQYYTFHLEQRKRVGKVSDVACLSTVVYVRRLASAWYTRVAAQLVRGFVLRSRTH